MKLSLTEERPNSGPGKKRVQYISNPDLKEVRKICPWAIVTYPHNDGHMAFETVAGYNEWLRNTKNKG